MVTSSRPGVNGGKQRRLLNERALTAAKQGDWEGALSANQELLQRDPNAAELHNRVGKALSELGRFREAHAAYVRASELDAHNTIAQRNARRLELLKEAPDQPGPGHPLVRSHVFIEETGKTAIVSLAHPAEAAARTQMTPGDPVELRVDAAGDTVEVFSVDGAYLGEVEPRLGERMIELMREGNRYSSAIVEHEEDTLRIILHEIYQDPSVGDKLSFPTRVRGAAPRAYIRKDILFDVMEEGELLGEGEEEEGEIEEAEEEPELEDEEFGEEDLDDNAL